MTQQTIYHIGTLNQPWGEEEKSQWFSEQTIKRSYFDDVVTQIERLRGRYTVEKYGVLDYLHNSYPLFAVRSNDWQASKPTVLVTGGVHGYETSGVHGALRVVDELFERYQEHFNLVVAPCISPWGYETINRWNPDAIDPNRNFVADSPSGEAKALIDYVTSLELGLLAHIDLHETTDTDNSEFRPAKAARDGEVNTNWNIPDGFYLVANSANEQPEFQRAVLEEVAKVTHIADADDDGNLIGETLTQHGVIALPTEQLGLCIGFSKAKYSTTTEVYPDSSRTTPDECNQAQVAAVRGALEFLLKQAK
ncbi:peptidase [Idiomarina tyrosinivorans]|uniref:Peptidase n=1 Tax=Idiomarina tyrosinivorans TaxID=1445662 RepID=A0A432ZUD4_9GAMM|nr:M14 family metallocarboxypeptidase [Idiomarina tyrosinivorans]RUO81527.1 peptidase [Idiomarina tyrosinivorans]